MRTSSISWYIFRPLNVILARSRPRSVFLVDDSMPMTSFALAKSLSRASFASPENKLFKSSPMDFLRILGCKVPRRGSTASSLKSASPAESWREKQQSEPARISPLLHGSNGPTLSPRGKQQTSGVFSPLVKKIMSGGLGLGVGRDPKSVVEPVSRDDLHGLDDSARKRRRTMA